MADFTCDICTRSFKLRIELKKHMEEKHDAIEFSCDACQRKFISNDDLDAHKQTYHSQNVLKIRKLLILLVFEIGGDNTLKDLNIFNIV